MLGDETHAVILDRLHRELAQRRELQARLLAILQRKQETEATLAEKVKRFEDLKHHLHQLIKVTAHMNANAKQICFTSSLCPSVCVGCQTCH